MDAPNIPLELLDFLDSRCPENRICASDSNDHIRWHLGRRSVYLELKKMYRQQNPAPPFHVPEARS